jgi:flavin-dependent dehydrogenase
VSGLVQDDDGVVLHTSAGIIRARYVVAADGATSRVARAAGWPSPARVAAALEWELSVDGSALARFSGVARFDFGCVPGGYAWVFPKRAHLSVGILGTRRPVRDLPRLLARYLETLDLRPEGAAEQHAALVPLVPRPGGCTRGRVFLAGDAAGLVDPLTCEGITYAARSGEMAAAALLESSPAAARAAYALALEREILPELARARALARVLDSVLLPRPWLFDRLGQPFCEAMAAVLAGSRTYGELLGAPANYAHLLRRLCFPARAKVVSDDSLREGAHAHP